MITQAKARLFQRAISKSTTWMWLALVLLAAIAVASVLFATRLGAGLGDDSYVYIQTARSMLAGEGLVLNDRYGALLPLVLTAIGASGIDPQDGIRWLNALLFGINGILVALVIRKIGASGGFTVLGAALFVSSESMLEIHSWAMSEPLHLALTLGALVLLSNFVQTRQWRWLVAAAALAGLSALARFVGWLAIGVGAFFLLVWPGDTLVKRIRAAAGFSLIAMTLPALSAVYNWSMAGYPFGTRPVVWIQADLAWFISALGRLEIWLLPGRIVHGREVILALGLLVLLGVGLAWASRRLRGEVKPTASLTPLPALLGLFSLVFLAFHVILMFTDNVIGRSDALNNRYLTPIQAGFWIFIVLILWRVYQAGQGWERGPVLAAAAFLILLGTYRSVDTARLLHTNGMGYAGERWHHSETVAYLQQHADVPLISTGNYGIYFWTGRLPRSIDSFTSLEEMRQYQRNTGAWLVIQDGMPPELYHIDSQALIAGQEVVQDFSEATIYQLSEP